MTACFHQVGSEVGCAAARSSAGVGGVYAAGLGCGCGEQQGGEKQRDGEAVAHGLVSWGLGGGVGVPEVGAVFAVEDDAVFPGRVGVRVEGVVAGGVVAASAGWLAGGVFFGRALGAAVDVERDAGAVGVDQLLRDVELVEGVGLACVAELPDDGGDLVVGGVFCDDEGEAVVAVVEDCEGGGWGGGARWVG